MTNTLAYWSVSYPRAVAELINALEGNGIAHLNVIQNKVTEGSSEKVDRTFLKQNIVILRLLTVLTFLHFYTLKKFLM